MNWSAVRIWVAVILLLDAAFGLWNHERIRVLVPKVNILYVVLAEAVAALVLVLIGLWR